ncbi:MAG: hypothetical protein ABIP51_01130 [Bacteroidia bacterium]
MEKLKLYVSHELVYSYLPDCGEFFCKRIENPDDEVAKMKQHKKNVSLLKYKLNVPIKRIEFIFLDK